MPKVTIAINPYLLGQLQELLQVTIRSLDGKTAVQPRFPDNADLTLQATWNEGLVDSLKEDTEQILTFLKSLRPGHSSITLNDEEAEKVLRAASAVRLKLCESCLKEFDDASIEHGDIEFQNLSPELQQVYAAYIFLANIQEQIVAEVDPDASLWAEQDVE